MLNSLVDYRSEFSGELLGTPSAVMGRYLEQFGNNASDFINGLAGAMTACTAYAALQAAPPSAEGFAWSQVHFLNAINCTLISTRLFLSGYLVASGNQSRQAIESLAFGVLLPFPKTGVIGSSRRATISNTKHWSGWLEMRLTAEQLGQMLRR
jgi:hypothetical protein